MTTVGERLSYWGKINYPRAKDFATALEIPASALSAYYNNNRKPGTMMQAKLRKLGCNIEWLMTGEGEMNSTPPAATVLPAPIENQFAIEATKFIDFMKETYEARLADKEEIIQLLKQQVADKSQSDSGVTNSPSP
ncbi:MAG: helix-turn-helix domain-containing protein, partial [Candidatus Kapabacteria bacterium]|nr:helix-turn-helix domain-containing protein [Candidatus Kapabacteria bacterium]